MNDPQGPEGAPAAPPHDPWSDRPDWSGRPDRAAPPGADGAEPGDDHGAEPDDDVYLAVHATPEFRRVRRQYRRFVVPAALAFLAWYLSYVVAATVAPDLMGRRVAGPVNVALLAGLGQFATTFLLTWAYARHARLRRDPAALDLRWDIAMRTRRADGYVGTRRPSRQEPGR
ncbi:DUF485 domain-containing protein [Streptomyces sp. WMMC500]|uniref:DUF485 domain-containing protein n=1 Tax=Streptomyces sp. WMMC500 TaxID=3015154 RepID=UPI00248CC2AF|nr:DUF485 domain-containing protein [Streptomyces sp. WMMC500]WBB62619.1 DUF485 domain-containing protein [Streptomyces sp. WMMC500]